MTPEQTNLQRNENAPAVQDWGNMLITKALTPLLELDTNLDKVTALARLTVKVAALDAYEHWHPRGVCAATQRRNYTETGAVQVSPAPLSSLHTLQNGTAIVGGWDGAIRIYRSSTDGEISRETLTGHKAAVLGARALFPNTLYSADASGTILGWTQSAEKEWTAESIGNHSGGITCFDLLPNETILTGGRDGVIKMWRKSKMTNSWSSLDLVGHSDSVTAIHALPDNTIISGGRDYKVLRWTIDEHNTASLSAIAEHTDTVSAVQGLPDGSVISASWGGDIVFSAQDGTPGWSANLAPSCVCMHALSASRILIGDTYHTVRLLTRGRDGTWNEELLRAHTDTVTALQGLSDGRVVSIGRDGYLRFWRGASTDSSTTSRA